MYIDSHAHVTSLEMIGDIDLILQRAQGALVEKIVNICTDEKTLEEGIALRKRYPWVYLAASTTPHDVEKEGESFFPIVQTCADQGSLIAIGETGLDYHYEHSNRACQQDFLLRYFDLAVRVKLPLIFHCRDAFSDLFSLTDGHYLGNPGLLHCFTGSLEEAKGVLDRGWYVSISGIITFKKSEALRQVVKYIPLDRLLIETDSPYLAPQSQRGRPNEPSYIVETVAAIAALKGKTSEEIGNVTRENAEAFFSFSKLKKTV